MEADDRRVEGEQPDRARDDGVNRRYAKRPILRD